MNYIGLFSKLVDHKAYYNQTENQQYEDYFEMQPLRSGCHADQHLLTAQGHKEAVRDGTKNYMDTSRC